MTELFLHLSIGNMSGSELVLHCQCLFKGESSFVVALGFVIDEANVMQARSAWLEALSDLKTLNRVIKCLLLSV